MRTTSPAVLKTLFIAVIILLFSIQLTDYLNFGVDDVFISMRVAENFANGKGPFINAGEHVEGYSNPLWVGLLTIGAKLGFNSSQSENALLWFAKFLSFGFGIGVLILLYFIIKNIKINEDSSFPLV